jgi:hypothetical protein
MEKAMARRGALGSFATLSLIEHDEPKNEITARSEPG